MTSKTGDYIFSDTAFTSMLKWLKHIDDREIPLTHFRVLLAICRDGNEEVPPCTPKQIARTSGLSTVEVEAALKELVKARYVHEVVPTFGSLFTYKLGPVGGTLFRSIRTAVKIT